MDVVVRVTEVLELCQGIAGRAQEAISHKETCNALAKLVNCLKPTLERLHQSPELAHDETIVVPLAGVGDELQKAKVLVDYCCQFGLVSAFMWSKERELKEAEGKIQIYVSFLNLALTARTVLNSKPGQSSSTSTSTSQRPSAAPDPEPAYTNQKLAEHAVSAKLLCITWGHDPRYWEWTYRAGSWFGEVAYLKMVCWLHVTGTMRCNLPPGRYTLSWRLNLATLIITPLNTEPVVFDFETSGGQRGSTSRNLALYKHESRDAGQGWRELDVGEFVISPNAELPVQINFCMRQTEDYWKMGLYLDGVHVQKTSDLA